MSRGWLGRLPLPTLLTKKAFVPTDNDQKQGSKCHTLPAVLCRSGMWDVNSEMKLR